MEDEDCSDYLEPSTDEYALVNSIDILFKPRPWPVYEVRVLKGANSEPLALVAVSDVGGGRKTRAGLPDEIFSHQLADLDLDDPYDLAAFMGEYGFLGPALGSLNRQRDFDRELARLDPADHTAVDQFERRFGYSPKPYFSGDAPWQGETETHYAALKPAYADLAARLAQAQPNARPLAEARVCAITSIPLVRRRLEDWLFCARHLKALVQYHTPQELARALDEDELAVVRNCEGAINIVQGHLSETHPVLALRDLTDGYTYTPIAERSEGSFEEALALQLWNFTLEAKDGFTVCKECGQVFVRRQSKSRKGPARTTGLFCCDRCKNRYAQREHRKTEGYRMKQKRKRGQSAAGEAGEER